MKARLTWWTGDRILWLILALATTWVVLVPLLYTVNSAFYAETKMGLATTRSLQAFVDVYATREYLVLLWNCFALALLVTAVSLVVGCLMAFLVARTDLPGKKWLDLLIILPIFLSPFTGLIAWIALGSEKTGFVNGTINAFLSLFTKSAVAPVNIFSYTGTVWIMFLFFCPFVYLFTLGTLRSMDSSLEESARTTGATYIQTIFKVTLPLAIPAIVASALLVFIMAAEMYTIPGIIGQTAGFKTLPWRIYQDSTIFPVKQAHAAASGTILLLVTSFGIWVQRRLTRVSERFVTVTGKGFRGRPIPIGRLKWAAFLFIALYVLSADVLPFGSLIISSFMKHSAPTLNAENFTLRHYEQIFTIQNTLNALWNTILLAIAAGAVCVVAGYVISYMEVRKPTAATKLLAFLGVLPVAVPGLVYGIGLLWTYLRTPLYGTMWVLLLAYIAKFLPYGIIVSRTGLLQIHPDLEQGARMVGATGIRTLRSITAPLMKASLISGLFFVMLLSIKELSASILLYSQKSQVLSVLTWHYMDAGNYQFAAAIGVVQSLIMIGLVIATRAIFRVNLEENVF